MNWYNIGMIELDAAEMRRLFTYEDFLPVLRRAFIAGASAPPRAHYEADGTTLLLMPAWNGKYLGVKTVTVSPSNRDLGLPSVHATYTLYDRPTGSPIAAMDGRTLTNLRTASASALAAGVLAPEDACRLVMIGAGALAPELIRAHAAVRGIQEVRVHARTPGRVAEMIGAHDFGSIDVRPGDNLDSDITEFAQIISAATTSNEAVFRSASCQPGQHIDLVGSYQKHTREADDDLMTRAYVLMDTEMASVESGDLAIPLASGVLTPDRVLGTLAEVLTETPTVPAGSITVFKSVGVALEDLALAEFFANRYSCEENA